MAAKLTQNCWSPFKAFDWDAAGPPNPLASGRIKKDIAALFMEPLPGIFIIPDESQFCLVHCLVLGPPDTPYEGGFFHFVVRFGPSYPIHPPRVQFMTTAGGRVRFNPNLYSDGKVCLSILGTWQGPPWRPVQNLGTLLLSIQSLLNDKPFYNEPGLVVWDKNQSIEYNQYLTHETIRVSICDQLEDYISDSGNKLMPSELIEVMKISFMNNYEHYVEICNTYKKLDGKRLEDIYSRKQAFYNYEHLLERLEKLKDEISSSHSSIPEEEKETTAEGLFEKINKNSLDGVLEMPCTDPSFNDTYFFLYDSDEEAGSDEDLEDSEEAISNKNLEEEEETGSSIGYLEDYKLAGSIKEDWKNNEELESSIKDIEYYEEAKPGTENLENVNVNSDKEDLEDEKEAYSCKEDLDDYENANSSKEDLDDYEDANSSKDDLDFYHDARSSKEDFEDDEEAN